MAQCLLCVQTSVLPFVTALRLVVTLPKHTQSASVRPRESTSGTRVPEQSLQALRRLLLAGLS